VKPFITLYTPTFRRPKGLAACLESVGRQTIASEIEHIVIPDHVGLGIGGMYAKVHDYADAVHGRYVHFLADDDVLADPTVVEQVKAFADVNGSPAVVIVNVIKGHHGMLPVGDPWPPRLGAIDLGCIITRADVWKVHAKDYGTRYEGDFDHAQALFNAGHQAAVCDVLFLCGAVSHGRAEAAA